MTDVYPKDERPNAPPPYEQAVYYPQAPATSTTFGMFTTSPTVLQPQALPMGMYTTQAPPMAMYATPGKGMQPQGPPIGTHMLITTQSLMYGDLPIQCVCPHCQRGIATRVEKKSGILPWLICGGILLFGGWLGCCLIPFCITDLKDTEHYCPNCAVLLGTRRRM